MNGHSAQAREPWDYARRILLMVTGRTPQVVTETLYALAVAPAPETAPFIPTEIHLISTAEGAQDARLALPDSERGWFHGLYAHYPNAHGNVEAVMRIA